VDEKKNTTSLKEKLGSYLDRACEAEARGDYAEAEHLFKLALFCEGRLRPEVTDAKDYVDKSGPMYQEAKNVHYPPWA